MAGLPKHEVVELYRRYGFLLERRCRVLLRDTALAEDAVQDLLTTLLRRGESVKHADHPYRWLCRASDRVCLDLLRKNRNARATLPLDVVEPAGIAPGCDAEARRSAIASLAQLEPGDQELAIMLFVDGLSQGDAASELGLSRVTINKRVHRLRERLRASLDGPERKEEDVR